MAQEEITGHRDEAYSQWHRVNSISRHINIEAAQTLSMIDIDAMAYVEYDDNDREAVALIETARDEGQDYKCAKVLTNLAKRCKPMLPCFVVLYTLAESDNPAATKPGVRDITKFRVKMLHPIHDTEWRVFEPEAYARFLKNLRVKTTSSIDDWSWPFAEAAE